MSSDEPERVPLRKRSGFKWLLLASLAVNLFLVGLIAGHIYSGDGGAFSRPHRAAGHLAENLTPESRVIVRRVFEAHSARMQDLWRQLKAERRKLMTIFAAPEVDDAAARASFAEMRRIDGLVQAEFHEATLEIAKQLPAAERRKLNLRWKRERPGGRDKGPVRPMPQPQPHDGG